MINILRIELYKLYKRKIFIAILILSSFSLLYSLGVFLGWDFIEISGEIDILTFSTVMWSLLMMLGIPLIMFSYLAASTIGGEIQEGQILFEMSNSKSRVNLIVGKFLAIASIIFICYILNFVLSGIFYILLMSHSKLGNTNFFLIEQYHTIMLLKSISGIFLLVLLSAVAFVFSINFGVFRAIVFGLVAYVLLNMLMYIQSINKFIPGYFTLYDQAEFSISIFIYQLTVISILTVGTVALGISRFKKKDF